jgi:preprotein translocase subunit SecA
MNAIPSPGIYWGSYPERSESQPLPRRHLGQFAYRRQIAASREQMKILGKLDEPAFTDHVHALRARLAKHGLDAEGISGGLAAASEAIRRSSGIAVYDTQLFAACIILDNRLAEMATGEGKTLSALLAAATAALAGIPVHVLTANDYLVARDAELLTPAYARLGLSVGAVTQEMNESARRVAYGAAVTYVTAKELVFDYLRDGLRHGGRRTDLARRARALEGDGQTPLLRGLCMAVLDEADSLLIDEAQTPLILSRQEDDPAARGFHWQALMLADRLVNGKDFIVPAGSAPVELSETGRQQLATLAEALGGRWRSWRMREDVVSLALAARHRFRRDRDYLVRDGKIEIIDETTGRTAPGRVWSRGLHTLIELKEGCKPTPATRTLAQITYQRFFPRYLRLGGMSGTLTEVRGELREIYKLPVVRVPLRTPGARQQYPSRLFANRECLWTAVAERIGTLRRTGRPVLVGTGSVGESEELSTHLTAAGIPHQVLNARFEREEAAMVATAGQAGQVTVTTNMAGRGTDIPLGPGVAAAGGLHVLCCQHNAAPRLDRQLQGRCARQGDPGSTETWLAIVENSDNLAQMAGKKLTCAASGEVLLPNTVLRAWMAWQQAQRVARQRHARRLLLQADQEWERGLAFRGRGE